MATPLYNLAETALVNYLTSGGVGTCYAGMGAGDKDSPAVCCVARVEEEDPIGSGNFRVSADISVKTAASSDTTHQDLVANVWTLLDMDSEDLGVQLSAATNDLTVWGAHMQHRTEHDREQDVFVTRFLVGLYCSPRSFS